MAGVRTGDECCTVETSSEPDRRWPWRAAQQGRRSLAPRVDSMPNFAQSGQLARIVG